NGVAERWVGSARRELLDHIIPLNESHFRRLGRDYLTYYHQDRTHIAWTRTPLPNEPSKGVLAFKPESCPLPGWAIFTIVTVGRKRRKTRQTEF
ncbi:MAG TPA: hypothetical protein VHZ55_02135, partial [Bryobacteraceae bacterium]|nr:hypothetical protein [Bryobacteraceae bacterium]